MTVAGNAANQRSIAVRGKRNRPPFYAHLIAATRADAFILAAAVSTAGGLAYAKQSGAMEEDSAADLARAKISLSQAIGTAESHAAGKAVKAELDSEKGALAFDVEVVTADKKVMDVRVDANDGKVLSSQLDTADRGGKEDQDD